MKKLYLLFIILILTACTENKEGIRIDLSKHNDTVTVTYTNLSDSIYVLNGIMCRPMHENEKMEEDRKPVSIDPNEATIMPYFDENNQPPYITKFTYEKNEDELILQKKRDSLFNRSTNNDHIYLESVLILQPKTTRTINFEISQNSDKYNFQILDYYNIGSPGRNMYNRISPVLKDVNPNYYLYKYSFNPSSQLKIKID
ncbi:MULTISPECIES: hypothetical protein [unclassified Empedobacter]|uniref:hypothetical protein n=1 Tax=unclassified Empedobacter TaxID=2643773 RepID=UPI002446C58A|nr:MULTISPECIES: hypothetical protein [unclassified Empedobacter]MDH2207290.1 hypothetical protein [Empedobacter sp. GD03644]